MLTFSHPVGTATSRVPVLRDDFSVTFKCPCNRVPRRSDFNGHGTLRKRFAFRETPMSPSRSEFFNEKHRKTNAQKKKKKKTTSIFVYYNYDSHYLLTPFVTFQIVPRNPYDTRITLLV
jgi:hypothetical protein